MTPCNLAVKMPTKGDCLSLLLAFGKLLTARLSQREILLAGRVSDLGSDVLTFKNIYYRQNTPCTQGVKLQ